MAKLKVIAPEKIKPGMVIRDGFGNEGMVEENMHPWGFTRLQYCGYTVIKHPNPKWYRLVKDFLKIPICGYWL